MKALDTNILVRFLVSDDKRQSEAVYPPVQTGGIRENGFLCPLAGDSGNDLGSGGSLSNFESGHPGCHQRYPVPAHPEI